MFRWFGRIEKNLLLKTVVQMMWTLRIAIILWNYPNDEDDIDYAMGTPMTPRIALVKTSSWRHHLILSNTVRERMRFGKLIDYPTITSFCKSMVYNATYFLKYIVYVVNYGIMRIVIRIIKITLFQLPCMW